MPGMPGMGGARRPSAVVFDLPDHEYWNKQSAGGPLSTFPFTAHAAAGKGTTVASTYTPPPSHLVQRLSDASVYSVQRDDRSASVYSRRLSRKLPPQLTESLENIASVVAPASPHTGHSPLSRIASLSLDRPLQAVLEQPPAPPPVPSVPPHARPASQQTRRPSTASTTYTLIPDMPLPQHDDFAPALAASALPSRASSLASKHASLPRLYKSASSSTISASTLVTPSASRNGSTVHAHDSHHHLAPRVVSGASSAGSSSGRARSSSSVGDRSSGASSSGTESVGMPVSCSSGSASTCGTWSVIEEFEQAERAARFAKTKESRKQKKLRKRAEADAFTSQTPPTLSQLFEAGDLEVIGEDGERVKFGDLVSNRKTVVVFIRHWFCSLCAQYMKSIVSEVSPEALEAADVDMVIIGNGSNKMIDGYRNKHFKCPFKMYTDPKLRLYRALGLTRQTGDAGADEDAGDYLVQTVMEQTVETVKRATRMPLRMPGHFLQLGGEFVFDGPLSVTYTNRMTTTRDHSPIRDVVAAAGVRLEYIHYEPGPAPPPVHRDEAGDAGAALDDEETAWAAEREATLERIQRRKALRRQGGNSVTTRPKTPVDIEATMQAAAMISATVKLQATKAWTPAPIKPSFMRRNSSVKSSKIRIVQASEAVEEVHGVVGTVF